jgi:tetratricopeptide (TPR) repeat protein
MTAFLFQNFFGVTFRQPGAVTFLWLALGFITVADAGLQKDDMSAGEPAPTKLRLHAWTPGRPPAPALALLCAGLIFLNVMLGRTLINTVRCGLLSHIAEFEAKRGNFEQAVYLGEKAIALNPYSVFPYYITGYSIGKLGKHERSLELNGKALSLLPGNGSVYYNMGVNYKELGRFEEAERAFERAIELMPTAERHHAALAELLIDTGRLDEALARAEEAARIRPKSPELHTLLADIHARRGYPEEALAHLQAAAKLSREDPALWEQCARLAARLQSWDDCAKASRAWLRYDPSSAEAANLLGASYFSLGDYRRARSAFQKARKLAPDDLSIRLKLAITRAEMGDIRRAKRELETIIELAPDSTEAATARKLLGQGSAR